MYSRLVTAALVAAVLVTPARRSAAAKDATLLRVFNDGTSLVSYGEPATHGRVLDADGRGAVAAAAVDRPPGVARELGSHDALRRGGARRAYLQTQAEDENCRTAEPVVHHVEQRRAIPNPVKRLELVERARKTLAEWPLTHYNYRANRIGRCSPCSTRQSPTFARRRHPAATS